MTIEIENEREFWSYSKIKIMEGAGKNDLVMEITAFDIPPNSAGSDREFSFFLNHEDLGNYGFVEEVSLESAKQIRDFLAYANFRIESRGDA